MTLYLRSCPRCLTGDVELKLWGSKPQDRELHCLACGHTGEAMLRERGLLRVPEWKRGKEGPRTAQGEL